MVIFSANLHVGNNFLKTPVSSSLPLWPCPFFGTSFFSCPNRQGGREGEAFLIWKALCTRLSVEALGLLPSPHRPFPDRPGLKGAHFFFLCRSLFFDYQPSQIFLCVLGFQLVLLSLSQSTLRCASLFILKTTVLRRD